MSYRFHLGPPQVSISHSQTVLVTESDGTIKSPSHNGLFFADTRLISRWEVYANGEPWDVRTSSVLSYNSCTHFLSNRTMRTERGVVESGQMILQITRSISGGMHEDLQITNFSDKPQRFRFEVEVESDFADLLELKLGTSTIRGVITSEWDPAGQTLCVVYVNKRSDDHPHFKREFSIRIKSEMQVNYANGRFSFDLDLMRGKRWQACMLYSLLDSKQAKLDPPLQCFAEPGTSVEERQEAAWRSNLPKVWASNSDLTLQFQQSTQDIEALRLTPPDIAPDEYLPAAGIPWFATVFGRDSLIASIQYLMVDQGFALGTLAFLEKHQGRADRPFYDEQPGRIMHELRYGEPSKLQLNLFTPYYGTADATPLFIIGLHSAWQWGWDTRLLERHLPAAESCLRWIDDYGDMDGDGIQEYLSQSPKGYENLGWKDSQNSVVGEDGIIVTGMKAINELQGYAYDAWLRMAEIYHVLGDPNRANLLRAKARSLYGRFNDLFWDDDLGCYAYGLDADKRKIRSVSSDMGHCLWSGIVPDERATIVSRRLMRPDMSSGWGIRTLSASNPAFNPFSYHNGSVWPHDNSLIAYGFRRYDLAEDASVIIHDVCDAATHFQYNQLPEFYAGVQRVRSGRSNLIGDNYVVDNDGMESIMVSQFPVQCFQASVPQAWAAGSTFLFLQTILGLHPSAQDRCLYVDPQLPFWLSELKLSGLRVGESHVSLRFWQEDNQTRFEVLEGDVKVSSKPFRDAANMAP